MMDHKIIASNQVVIPKDTLFELIVFLSTIGPMASDTQETGTRESNMVKESTQTRQESLARALGRTAGASVSGKLLINHKFSHSQEQGSSAEPRSSLTESCHIYRLKK